MKRGEPAFEMLSDVSFTIEEIEYTFNYTEREGADVVTVDWTSNGESFRQWSAEAPFPRTQEEAETALLEFGWSEGDE